MFLEFFAMKLGPAQLFWFDKHGRGWRSEDLFNQYNTTSNTIHTQGKEKRN